LVDISGNADIAAAFTRSNIQETSWDHQRSVLERTLAKVNLDVSNVLALSQAEVSLKPDGSSMGTRPMLLIVFKLGIATAEEKGVFGKRVETMTATYNSLSAVPDEKLYAQGRGEIAIQFFKGGSVPLFRVGWNWSHGGPTSLTQAAEERDRILNITQRAMQGEWTAPSTGPMAQPVGTQAGAGSTASGGHVIADGPPASIRQHIIDWVIEVFREAGAAPTEENVNNIARRIGAGLTMQAIRFAERKPLPALTRYVGNLPGELWDRLDQIDDIYGAWIRLTTEADARTQNPSDPAYRRTQNMITELTYKSIDSFLGDSRKSFVEGVRADYGG
jgi:hypothetical protein